MSSGLPSLDLRDSSTPVPSLRLSRGGATARLSSPLALAVFAAALFTSMAVTVISTRSVDDYLREDLSLRLPAVVQAAGHRLDLWYAQRASDVATFAGSAALAEHADRLGRQDDESSREVSLYLESLRSDYPFFSSLFVLDAAGTSLLVAGTDPLPGEEPRRRLAVASTTGPRVHWIPERRVHVVSAPLTRAGHGLTLHAVMPASALRSALSPVTLEEHSALHVLDAEGAPVIAVGEVSGEETAVLEAVDPDLGVVELALEDGDALLVSTAAYPRFGWTLAVEQRAGAISAPATLAMQRMLGMKLATAVFFTLLAVILSGAILHPVLAFQDAARALADGETRSVSSPHADDTREPGVIARAMNEVRGHLRRYQKELVEKRKEIAVVNERLQLQNEQLRRANQILERLSVTDELTGLYNRRYFREHLPREMKRATRTGEPLSLVLFDIDDFKQLNDRYGHAAGDAVLKRVARVMQEQTREMDLLSRYGGEEFALLASQTPVDGAIALAEKIRLAVSRASVVIDCADGQEPLQVSISAGVAGFRGEEDALFEDADRALYRAKASGKDCVIAG